MGRHKPNPDLLRARDYTPTNVGMGTQTGGADQFLDFIKTEVFPFMDANYKVDNSNKTVMGCSLEGYLPYTPYLLIRHYLPIILQQVLQLDGTMKSYIPMKKIIPKTKVLQRPNYS